MTFLTPEQRAEIEKLMPDWLDMLPSGHSSCEGVAERLTALLASHRALEAKLARVEGAYGVLENAIAVAAMAPTLGTKSLFDEAIAKAAAIMGESE